jgi:serine/threonine-protein kinase HipA
VAEGPRRLDVWCFDRLVGTLVDARPDLVFTYDPGWLADRMPPLSQSLPLDGRFTDAASAAFFGGLLPEGVPRERLARRLGVSDRNDFSLLTAVGGDTAGAISLQKPGGAPQSSVGDVDWLDDADLIKLIDELPSRPMHADEDGEYRLSLAGAQDKLPVVVGADGRIGLTRGQTPSTHILKTPIERLEHTVANEALCPAIGHALGIVTVSAIPHRIGDREFLLIERYDRRGEGEGRARLHQEDFCQALGIPTERKYQAEGGPSLADCFALLRGAAGVPGREIVKFLDAVALSFLVGNHDAHGKNYSLLYLPDGPGPGAVLAPAYDIISTFAYHKSHGLTRKMAMSIGGQYKPEYLESRHLDRLLGEAGLGPAAARRRLRGHALAAPGAARAARAELAADGWDNPVFNIIIDIIDRRSAWLADLAAPLARLPAEPLEPADAPLRVAPGQRWRDSTTGPGVPASIITVDEVDRDGIVTGFSRPYGAGSDAAVGGAWPIADFARFALIADRDWPTHRIAAELPMDDPRASQLSRISGELGGARSHTLTRDGLGGPETCWDIVAPTEADALDFVRRIVGPDVAIRPASHWRTNSRSYT